MGSPTAAPKSLDAHAINHLLDGYRRGGYIDVLIKELVDEGYRRPGWHELAFSFSQLSLPLSVDRVLDEAEKPAVAEAIRTLFPYPQIYPSDLVVIEVDEDDNEATVEEPVYEVELSDSASDSPQSPEVEYKPLDRNAVIYIVERFRSGLVMEWIVDELADMGYETPSWHVTDKILEANGMSEEDGRVIGPNGFKAHEGRVWGEIVIPEGIFDEEA